jgi:DNA-binding NarL/FixJ family response regulator
VPEAPQGEPTIRILIADDHAIVREGIRRMLQEASGIEVVAEAADGDEALQKARAYRPDLIVTDLQMPGVGGIELIKALKEDELPTKVIILTAHLAGDLIVEGMKAGADGYLLKDAPAAELAEAVRAVHRGETFLQHDAASELARQVRAGAGERGTSISLTPRELEVLGLLARGRRNKEIARDLTLSEATVRFHVAHIFQKLDVGSRTEAVTKALQLGIVTPP